MLRVENCRPRLWWFVVIAVIVTVVSPALAQGQDPRTNAKPEQAGSGAGSASRSLVWTGIGERGLSQAFPEAAVWLELEEGVRALGLFYPETRLPAQGALVVLADEGETAASGLAGAVARALAARGWAVLTLGLEAPSPALQRMLAGPVVSAPGPEANDEAPTESVMIDVMAPENADDLEARYRNRISQALEAGLAELVERGYEAPALMGIGRASIHVTNRILEGASVSALVWVAPQFYPSDRADLPERLTSLGTALLDLHPAGSGGGEPGWSTGEKLLRAGADGYQRQPIPGFGPPSAAFGDTIASRVAAWLESR
ncbi:MULTISPECIES: DUF3530 family protein [Marinobacter]|uniref:Alpha/beta hydrolase family protein n=1 Tax=Marinobacter metalliresistant TaxID=2961995 RepID=A0ABZ2VWR3_9GAMM|nr:DUF3530 family protein [Marinobacter sp. Arc7-DN-1]AXS83422.1 DUF3530 family protein [Marinobacter sp. Arc7-DN-1]